MFKPRRSHQTGSRRAIDFDGNEVSILRERHYRLTEASEISEKDLAACWVPVPD